MVKMFKNHMLSIFIAIAFSFSQVANIHANHLRNTSQQESIPVSIIEQGKKKAISITSLYIPNLNYGEENEATIEGKIEKVFEPITLGFFTTIGALGFGFLTGTVMGIITGILGWAVGKMQGKK